MQKKVLFFAGAVLCLLLAGWGYYKYQKPRTDAAALTPAFRLPAEQLYSEYSNNESVASKKYNDKIVEVTGVVKEIQATEHGTNILLAADAMGGVNCSFEKTLKQRPAAGNRIKVKGRCAGFLMDVSLVDAVRTDN